MTKQDIGPVSAYALAVEYGFEGTEEEWAVLQAQAGQNAQAANEAADRAQAIKDSIPSDYVTLTAKVDRVSDDVAALSEEIVDLETETNDTFQTFLAASDKKIALALAIGTVHNGESLDNPGSSANTAFYPHFISTESGVIVDWDGTTYKTMPCYYDANYVFQEMGGWSTEGSFSIVPTTKNFAYCVIEIRRLDNADFSESELSANVLSEVKKIDYPFQSIIDITEDLKTPLKITKNCIIRGNGHKLDANGANYGLTISGGISVDIYDLHIVNARAEGCVVFSGCTCNCYGCTFNGTADASVGGNGFQASGDNIITNCFNCEASGNINDGFNYHGENSRHMLVNCIANENGGDGTSNHEPGSYLGINGGIFNNNKKAGIAAPTYSGAGDIVGAYCEGNKYGLQIYNGEDTTTEVTVRNCTLVGNTDYAMQISGYKVKASNNVYANNGDVLQILHGGTLVDYGSKTEDS